MRSVYLSRGKCEALFASVVKDGNPRAFMRLMDATVHRLCEVLRRGRPPLPYSDIETICENGFLKTALRMSDFRTWAQAYVYALRVSLSLRRQRAMKRVPLLIGIEDILDTPDPTSASAETRAEQSDLILTFAEKLQNDGVAVVLHVARSAFRGPEASEPLAHLLGSSHRTSERVRAAVLDRASRFLKAQG